MSKKISTGTAARWLGVSGRTVRRYIQEGIFQTHPLPFGHHRLLADDILNYMRQASKRESSDEQQCGE
jgi:predicted site-specific integrase-resolvase